MRTLSIRPLAILTSLTMMVALPLSAQASHAWGDYHWARTSNPIVIPVIDSMSSNWNGNLDRSVTDWDESLVLDVAVESGSDSTKTRKSCPSAAGKVRACNATYGFNGWLGLAQIWVSGGHIVQAVAKMNDSYLSSSVYSHGRQHVICQEIGHAWGLGHQDESGADLGTCMDYAIALDNPSPNRHDYDQLEAIYRDHSDAAPAPKKQRGNNRSRLAFLNANVRAQENWGQKVHAAASGKSAVFVRSFGGGLKIVTHVTWAR